jgi:Secretion system C-terminal sorting domain
MGLLMVGLAGRAQSVYTYTGAITLTDPALPGDRLFRDSTPGQCTTTKAYPGVSANTPGVHYDTYTIRNSSATASTCLSLTLAATCTDATGPALFLTVYSGSFNPANLATGYKADLGVSPSVDPAGISSGQSMGVTLAPNEVAVLVVNGLSATAVCNSYILRLTSPVALPVKAGQDARPVLAAYPNPVEDVLRIEAAKAGHYTLYNATGAVVRQFSGQEVSLRELPGGVYMLQQDETKAATRIVKL